MQTPDLTPAEQFAFEHADQHIGCVGCRESRHESAFCECGQCFFCLLKEDKGKSKAKRRVVHNEYTFVSCKCGRHILWD